MEVKKIKAGYEIKVQLHNQRRIIHVSNEGVTISYAKELDYHDLQLLSKALQIATDLLCGNITIGESADAQIT